MRNENTEKKIQNKLSLWIILLLLIAVLAIVAIACISHSGENIPPSQADSAENSDIDSASTDSVVPEDSTRPEATQDATEETHPPVVIVQKADAEYEKWLAAAMVVCVSMEYPDFELEGVYAASSTNLEDKFSSEGTYILFTSDGNQFAIHANALEQERTAVGTKDISTEAIGFASYDFVAPENIDFDSMEEINPEDLGELIAQSILISIYEH